MMLRSADFSANRTHRFRLDRWWGNGPRVAFLGLNPSRAGENEDDPTVRKIVGFAARWGYNTVTIVNPFSLVMTNPRFLHLADNPVEARNRLVLMEVAVNSNLLIPCWGCDEVVGRMARRGLDPVDAVRAMQRANPSLVVDCLGLSKYGNPKHPSRLAYSTPRVPFQFEHDTR